MGFLREIVTGVRADVAAGRYAAEPAFPSSRRAPSLAAAVRQESARGALLVEFKRVSPGASEPRLPSRSVAQFVDGSRVPGLAGYSCLATRPRFEGSVADVVAVARATDRPVLFKDFVVDPAQVDSAALAGAAAVLLIARLEEERLMVEPLAVLAQRARARGLEVLLEVHARSELRHVAAVAPHMIGVNVRDLDTLRLEPDRAAATLREVAGFHPLLGMSGVTSPSDAARFWSQGADGILVGTAAAAAKEPGAFLRSLARETRVG